MVLRIDPTILIFRDSSPHSTMGDDNSTRYLQEMTLLLREQFPYSSIYPVLGDMLLVVISYY